MTGRSFDLGWYHIDAEWNLYIDGNLEKCHVDYINVDVKASGDDYVVKHFDRAGDLLTTLTLGADDLAPELKDRETEGRPMHL